MPTRRLFVSAAALTGAAAAMCPHCAAAMGGGVEVAQAELNAAGGSLPPPPGRGLKVPTIAYDFAHDFIATPEGMYLGECSGVAVNSQGHVFVLSRGNTNGPAYGAAATQLLEFGSDGKFIREIGQHLYAWSFAHTVKIDRHDHIWVTDKGSDMIVKFTPAGRVEMVFGRKQEASDEGTGPLKHPNPPLPPEDGRFRQVTDVAWDTDDNTYISDGYINSRIAKADKDGVWQSSWGTPGKGPLQFNTPHSIALDAQNRIYVADRGNRRIQVLDRSGNLLRQIVIDVDYPADARAPIGNLPTGARRNTRTRRSVGDRDLAAAQPVSVRRRCLSRPHLQDDARRRGRRRARPRRQTPRSVRLDSPDGRTVGDHPLRCRSAELARAKAHAAFVVSVSFDAWSAAWWASGRLKAGAGGDIRTINGRNALPQHVSLAVDPPWENGYANMAQTFKRG